ncbi:Doubled CXXCH motif protein [Marinobacter litoralis]|uniref:Doubled CXXCH motif protein n=2 Tax=Marinobacter litoralis TaxID=187981 RepID=A0A3M2RKC7_9GAMM|nr:Doubled CXXCH motif protein [Marinobacter litoralis]
MIKRWWGFLAVCLLVVAAGKIQATPSDCLGCHEREVSAWAQSRHALAMAEPGPETVEGDFFGARYEDSDIVVQFRNNGGTFLIHTRQGSEEREWAVRYTFGIYPLQQYLIDTGDGRLQAFNIAWDARDKSDGGQRWFRLDEPGHNRPGDAMHWTGIYQNWNNQCADCHSTGLERNYDPETDTYRTRFEHRSVSCGACHNEAQDHATAKRKGQSMSAGVELAAVGAWLVSEGKRPPRLKRPERESQQVNTCGKCHSLRTALTDAGSGRLHDQYSLSRLDEPLYYSDGRVREEVFVVGSFEQSKMFQAGVVCTDCHNPHTGKLKVEGNGVCAQCHNAGDYETPDHHHHRRGSEGAECVSCHMPEATFMKIDNRREHSFMVPRPDVSVDTGSPDVCLGCHTDQDRAWSIETVESWYPDLYQPDTWHHVQQRNLSEVLDYLSNDHVPAIRRATLLEQHGEALLIRHRELVAGLAENDHAVIRESAFRVIRYGDMSQLRGLAERGLDDDSLAVRLAAFESIVWSGVIPDAKRWEGVRQEYENYLAMQSDLPAGSVLKARYLLAGNYVYKAEQLLKRALRKDPGYVPATILLTDILRSGHRNLEAIRAIDDTLQHSPDDPQLIHLRGLIRIGLRDYPAALADLGRAHSLAPDQWLFGYRYAVALFQLEQKEKAREVIRTMLQRYPDNVQLRALMNHL